MYIIKCLLEVSSRQLLKESNGKVYNEIQGACIAFSAYHFVCFWRSTYLYVLCMCLYVGAYN